ncbi:MAG: glycosyltransferase family 4 protein [Armatimonadetes bacterium]|nr:glycosyltransferase family 4 protein [Armatimonadota bacterium]
MDSVLKLGVVGPRGIPDVPGGVEAHCAELYPRLVRAGVDVVLYGRQTYVSSQNWRGVRVVALPAPSRKGLEAAVHSFRAILAARRDGCRVVHVHSIGPGMAVPFARLLGLRVVFTVHAPDYLQKKWGLLARTYLRLGERLGSKWANQVITVSTWQREMLEKRYARAVHALPNGAPPGCKREAGPLLRSLGLKPGNYVLFVGRLIPDKRVEDLVEASYRLADEQTVVIVGDSTDSGYVESLTAKAGPRVAFVGSRVGPELEELYSNARLFAFPSAVEGLPVALIESLAYGIPCVASDIPGNREVLGGDHAGCLVPVADIGALAEAIDGLWHDDAERERLAAVGRNRATTEYSWDRIAADTLAVIANAAG